MYGALWQVLTFYVNFENPGCFSTFTGTNQYLTIAPDENTAHGVWMVVGTESDAGDLSTSKPAADDQRRVLFILPLPRRASGTVPRSCCKKHAEPTL